MIGKSPERFLRRSYKKQHQFTSSYSSSNSGGFGLLSAGATDGSSLMNAQASNGMISSSSSTVGVEKRLKSLESRTSIQSRHLYSYQVHSDKNDRANTAGASNNPAAAAAATTTGGSATTSIASQLQNQRWFKDFSRTNGFEERSRSIGDRLHTEESGTGGSTKSQQQQQQQQMQQSVVNREKKSKAMQVFVRVRPLNSKEMEGKNIGRRAVRLNEERNVVIVSGEAKAGGVFGGASSLLREEKLFEMNRAFSEDSSNEEIFNSVMQGDIRSNLFEGFNCTCFVYGMTGAGKTYTMFGDICNYMTMNSHVKGLIMLALSDILASVKAIIHSSSKSTTNNNTSFVLRMSYLEIYNEQIRDLLSNDFTSSSSSTNQDNLMVVEDPQRGVVVPGLTEILITDEMQVLESIRVGNTRRQMAATGQNEFSSRSHAIITFSIESTASKLAVDAVPDSATAAATGSTESDASSSQKLIIKTSKLCLVDLAGSERAAVTENRGIRLQEGANINRSLLALGNCINILADTSKKGAFVPYRDSKLTRLLKDSLGGNTQTYMIACISPASISAEETLNTLKYAQRARKITKTVTQNLRTITESAAQAQDSMKYISLIESMKREIESLKSQLAIKQAQGKPQIVQHLQQTNQANQAVNSLQQQQQHYGMNKLTKNKQEKNQPMIVPLTLSAQQSQFQQASQQTPREDSHNNFSPVSVGAAANNRNNSFFSDDLEDEVLIKAGLKDLRAEKHTQQQQQSNSNKKSYNNYATTPSTNKNNNHQIGFASETNNNNNNALTGSSPAGNNNNNNNLDSPLHNLWEDQESFSSSGKSVRISCTNTSNNGSVILFKRSPSQLNFTKPTSQQTPKQQQQQQQQQQQSLSQQTVKSNLQNMNYDQIREDRAVTDRSGEDGFASADSRMQLISARFVKNLEENWEIQQSIFELQQLQTENEEVLQSKNTRLKQLRGKLIQWVHENEISEIALGVLQLQETMTSNASILKRMQEALARNEQQKSNLQEEMITTLSSSSPNSEQVLKQLSQACQLLQLEKTDLHQANLEIKQQHNFIHSQFLQKVQQIKTMQQQIKEMQQQLDQKNSIISQNQMLLRQLLPSSAANNVQHTDVSQPEEILLTDGPQTLDSITMAGTVTSSGSGTVLRSTSSQNTRNKKFILEKQGYFDFKSKQSGQQSSSSMSTNTPAMIGGGGEQQQQQHTSALTVKTSSSPAGDFKSPNSPPGRMQPHQVLSQSTKANEQKASYFPTKKSSSAFSKQQLQLQQSQSSSQQQQYQQQQYLMQSTATAGTVTTAASQKQYTTPSESSGTPVPTQQSQGTYTSPNSQSSARLSTMYNKSVGSAATTTSTSFVGRKSIQTHREKYPLNKYNSSSISYTNSNNSNNPSVGSPAASTLLSNQKSSIPIGKHNYSLTAAPTSTGNGFSNNNYTPSNNNNNNNSKFIQQFNPAMLSPSYETRHTEPSASSGTGVGISSGNSIQVYSQNSIQSTSIANKQIGGKMTSSGIASTTTTTNKDMHNQHQIQPIQTDYKDELLFYGLSSREEEPSPSVNGNGRSKFKETTKHTSNQNYRSLPLEELIKDDDDDDDDAASLNNNEDLDASVSEFLKTDEFPENDVPPNITNSCVYPRQNLQQSAPAQIQPSTNSAYRPPIAVNLTLRRQPLEFADGSNSNNNNQTKGIIGGESFLKESNIVTPENNQVSIHKIDLYRNRDNLLKNQSKDASESQKRNTSNSHSNLTRSAVYSLNSSSTQQFKSPLRSNNKTSITKSIGNESASELSTTSYPVKQSHSKERTAMNPYQIRQLVDIQSSIPSSQRLKSLGRSKTNLTIEEGGGGGRVQSVSPPGHGVNKVNFSVMEVIEKQKQKQLEENERHLYLTNIAQDLFNPSVVDHRSQPPIASTTTLLYTPTGVAVTSQLLQPQTSSFSSQHTFFQKSLSPSLRSPQSKGITSTTMAINNNANNYNNIPQQLVSSTNSHLGLMRASLKTQISSINLNEKESRNFNKVSSIHLPEQI